MSREELRALEVEVEALRGRAERTTLERDALASLPVAPPAKGRRTALATTMVLAGLLVGFGGGSVARPLVDRPADGACASRPMPADASISLERTGCYGTCPSYTVTIHADGLVTFDGVAFVDTKGHAEARIPPEDVRRLFDTMLESCFSELSEEYFYPVTDHAWANTTLTADGRTKRVRHYLGDASVPPAKRPSEGYCWAPAALGLIEAEIDRVAGTQRWIGTGREP